MHLRPSALGIPLRPVSAKPPTTILRGLRIPSPRAMHDGPRFSPGTDESSASPALDALLSPSGGRWTLAKEGEALERSFRFKTFAKTWDFMTAVALQCKLKNHHPEWSNVYNTTFVRWTTHSPKGLSTKDLDLAAMCDSIAKDFGEIDPEPVSCELRDAADTVAASAGDCCAPKK